MTPEKKTISRVSPSLADQLFAVLFDFWILLGTASALTLLVSSHPAWSLLLHLGTPLLALPFFRFFGHRFFGVTPGQSLFHFKYSLPNGARALRLYDWLFLLKPKMDADSGHSFMHSPIFITSLISAFIFTSATSLMLWKNDPTVHPIPLGTLAIFAPKDDERATSWQVLPFFYATGTFPIRLPYHHGETGSKSNELSVEFSLPYEKGPPVRFLGKITAYWRELDSRLTLTGPLTLPSPSTPNALRHCFSGWLRCLKDRRKFWKGSVKPLIGDRTLEETMWFTTDNPFLDLVERPQGIYLRTSEERGRVREIYFLVGPKMAVQALVLDRPSRAEGDFASETLRKIVGSLRMSDDLQAPRAFINPKLAALRLGPKSTLFDLVAAEGYLLAKVSIEPKEAESFYHLGGLALTLYRSAKREGRIELTASSKTIVKNALKFIRDVDPNSKRIEEMEKFETEVESP